MKTSQMQKVLRVSVLIVGAVAVAGCDFGSTVVVPPSSSTSTTKESTTVLAAPVAPVAPAKTEVNISTTRPAAPTAPGH